MGAAWKTIPLFISSTFRDMHAERDQLNRVVFPPLEERLKGPRCRLEPIDLRVGVETDSTKTERERELQILKVCLAKIERSLPFLLVLLGDRYGWVPPALGLTSRNPTFLSHRNLGFPARSDCAFNTPQQQ
jgi:hypothetical protein